MEYRHGNIHTQLARNGQPLKSGGVAFDVLLLSPTPRRDSISQTKMPWRQRRDTTDDAVSGGRKVQSFVFRGEEEGASVSLSRSPRRYSLNILAINTVCWWTGRSTSSSSSSGRGKKNRETDCRQCREDIHPMDRLDTKVQLPAATAAAKEYNDAAVEG